MYPEMEIVDCRANMKANFLKFLKKISNQQPEYDYIYIDGSHMPKWVLIDAVLSWDLLKKGGLMIFDDYKHIEEKPPQSRPTGIDFLDNYI